MKRIILILFFLIAFSCNKKAEHNFKLEKNIDKLIPSSYDKIAYNDFIKKRGWMALGDGNENKKVYKLKKYNNYIVYVYDTIRWRGYKDSILIWSKNRNFKLREINPIIVKSIKKNDLYIFSHLLKEDKSNLNYFKDFLFYNKINTFSELTYVIFDTKNNEQVKLYYYINDNTNVQNSDLNVLLSKVTNLSVKELNDVIINPDVP